MKKNRKRVQNIFDIRGSAYSSISFEITIVNYFSIYFTTLPLTYVSSNNHNFSRSSVARTLMARLPRLFRTRSWVP